MVAMRWLRSIVAASLALALLSGLALLCPCPVAAMANHGCCAEPGFRAATSCCLTAPAPSAPAVVDGAAAFLSLAPTGVPMGPASVVAVADVPPPVRFAPLPPRVLRI